jgi:hypothetical protein
MIDAIQKYNCYAMHCIVKQNMTELLTIYLSTNEEKALEKFCEEHNYTPYSVLKTALHQLLDEGTVRRARQSEEISLEAQEKPPARETASTKSRNSLAKLLEEIKKSQTGNGRQ